MNPQKSAAKEQKTEEGTPTWAPEFFEKLKNEICAEVHARVAFSVRIMLDDLKKEIITQLDNPNLNREGSGCYCKELKKCKTCKEKKHAIKAALQLQRKEEKQLFRMNKRRVASESDSDNENRSLMRTRNYTPPANERKSSGKEQNGLSTTTMVENLNMAKLTLNEENKGSEEGVKIVNCYSKAKGETESLKAACDRANEDSKQKVQSTEADELLGATFAISMSQSSPSDSEFEVVSLPSNISPPHYEEDREATASDFDDTSVSGHCSETETETEFKDCKQSTGDLASDVQPKEPLCPQVVNPKTVAKAMVSSTSSVASGDSYATLCETMSGAEACASEAVPHVPERQRAPYSIAPPEGAEKINKEEIINNQPLPSEFLRDRQPYAQTCGEPKQVSREQPQTHPQPPPEQTTAPPKPTPRLNSAYRVDNLPESLWDEALTVAAQTYNAAKTAVGNLADAFVPDVDRVLSTPARSGGIPMPPPASVATAQQPQPSVPCFRTTEERQLYDMGFTDTVLNSRLLHRYSNDVHRVLQDLIGS